MAQKLLERAISLTGQHLDYRLHDVHGLTLRQNFSIVTYFDGYYDPDLDNFAQVIAVSTRDSIDVPKKVRTNSPFNLLELTPNKLVCDPFEVSTANELFRILGNVNRPGVVLLNTPNEDLLVRETDPGRWRLNTCRMFNGRPEDCFGETSLHLSFTSYQAPVFLSSTSGFQDTQVSVMETVVPVQDSGTWIADVDVLGAVSSGRNYRLTPATSNHEMSGSSPGLIPTSVGSWRDVLDLPAGTVVARDSRQLGR